MTFTIAGVQASEGKNTIQRMSVLLWGPPGVGKTTLAATAPGRKLLLLFDPDGDASIGFRDDVTTVNLASMTNAQVEGVKGDNPWRLREVLQGSTEHQGFDTLIVDSLTNFGYKALLHGVATSKGATVERPSLQGFGVRTALTHQLAINLITLTGKLNKHIVLIAHEGAAELSESGGVLEYPLGLGGQLPTLLPNLMSEVWYMHDMGKERKIMIRPGRQRKHMKTRMFTTTGDVEFTWNYDADKGTGAGIATWFDAWVIGGQHKLPLPK